MSLISELSGEVTPCAQSDDCLSSPVNSPHAPQCRFCRLAESNGGAMICWRPWDKTQQHPVLVAEIKQARKDKLESIREKRKGRSKPKMALLKRASRAEKKTGETIIQATINSGRSNKDGDWNHFGVVTLDSKLETKEIHPRVNLVELDKVRKDAERAGNNIGGLVLHNKFGRQVVVFDIADYSRLLAREVKETS